MLGRKISQAGRLEWVAIGSFFTISSTEGRAFFRTFLGDDSRAVLTRVVQELYPSLLPRQLTLAGIFMPCTFSFFDIYYLAIKGFLPFIRARRINL